MVVVGRLHEEEVVGVGWLVGSLDSVDKSSRVNANFE